MSQHDILLPASLSYYDVSALGQASVTNHVGDLCHLVEIVGRPVVHLIGKCEADSVLRQSSAEQLQVDPFSFCLSVFLNL